MTAQPSCLAARTEMYGTLDRNGEIRWKYPASTWINGVGVSRDGSVIAAGALDGTLYILDKKGELLAKTKTDNLIQQRSVAVSSEGNRIVVADQGALNGFDLFLEPEVVSRDTATLTPTMRFTSIPLKTTLPKTISSTMVTNPPETISTPESGIKPFLTVIALACLLFIMMRRNN